MVLRFVALAAALPLAACTHSLFESSTADGGHGHGGDANLGGDGGLPECRMENGCLGDVVAEFSSTQGGTLGRFHYLDDTRAPHDAYAPMTFGTFGGLDAWVGGGDAPQPAIATCVGAAPGGACAGLADRVLIAPSTMGAATRDPAIAWTSPISGTVHVVGDYRAADAATGSHERLLVSRNARNDLLFKDNFLPGSTPRPIDFTAEVLTGDQLVFAVGPPDMGSAVPIGVKLQITDANAFPGDCQFTDTMDDAANFMDVCQGASLEDKNDTTSISPGTAQAPSVSGNFGSARQFHSGDYIHTTGAAMDYSQDFTIQFWMKNDPLGDFTTETIYADWECSVHGGFNISLYQPNNALYVDFFWDLTKDYCGSGGTPAPPEGFDAALPTDNAWHFYRVSRSTTDGKLTLCIDGALKGTTSVPATASITSGNAPWLGRNVDFEPPYFTGYLDDVRVLSRALPCPTLP